MISTANNAFAAGGKPASEWAMTVLDLSIVLCVYRVKRPARLEDICERLTDRFEQPVPPEVASNAGARMVDSQAHVAEGDRLRAGSVGRETARPLMSSIIRIADQGARMLAWALMRSALRLTLDERGADTQRIRPRIRCPRPAGLQTRARKDQRR